MKTTANNFQHVARRARLKQKRKLATRIRKMHARESATAW